MGFVLAPVNQGLGEKSEEDRKSMMSRFSYYILRLLVRSLDSLIRGVNINSRISRVKDAGCWRGRCRCRGDWHVLRNVEEAGKRIKH